ncbi:MAG: ADP-ribosylglycohydrolase family protein, partial [Firmicutes bacterium]|nr:ADP-ribosylglycohydrolase family protein [Bacillota bacterium]
TLALICKAAGITHGHEINAMSCYLYTLFLRECLGTGDPKKAYRKVFRADDAGYRRLFSEETLQAHALLLENDMEAESFDPDRIPESGYVVDSLSVAVCSILKTGSYEDAVKVYGLPYLKQYLLQDKVIDHVKDMAVFE